MKKIFKYKLPRDGEVITITANIWKWLEIHEQDGWPHIWAIVDDEGQEREYEIVAWGTGWEWPEEMNYTSYLGTAMDFAGYVWHYFMQETTPVYATKTAADGVYDYDYLGTLTGSPVAEPYTITISCGDADSAVSAVSAKVCSNATTSVDYAISKLTDALVTGSVAELAYAH